MAKGVTDKRLALLALLVSVALGVGILVVWQPFRPASDPANLEWSAAEFRGATRLDAIASVDGVLVITGADAEGPAVWISRDGFRWERSTMVMRGGSEGPVDYWMSAAGGHGDRLVALGSSDVTRAGMTSWEPALWISGDGGRNWQEAPNESAPHGTLRLAATEDGYVALGQGPNGIPAVFTSRAGVEWTEVADHSAFGEASVEAIAVRGGQIVAVGSHLSSSGVSVATAWSSQDGIEWEPVVLSGHDAGNAVDVIVTDSGFVAVGTRQGVVTGAMAWQSRDGATWHEVELSAGDALGPYLVAGSGDAFVVIGEDGQMLTDGQRVTWWVLTASAAPRLLPIDGQVQAMVAIGDRYVGIGGVGCPPIGFPPICATPVLVFGVLPGSSPPDEVVPS